MKEFRLTHGFTHNEPHQIIIHAMGEYIQTAHRAYSAPEYLAFDGTSAHVFIRPDGTPIRGRKDTEGAFHALGYNVDTLGLEFLVEGTHTYATFLERIKEDWVTPEQYEMGAKIVANWVRKFKIESILRHSDVSPDRKVDPGEGFKWDFFIGKVRELVDGRINEY